MSQNEHDEMIKYLNVLNKNFFLILKVFESKEYEAGFHMLQKFVNNSATFMDRIQPICTEVLNA